MPNVRNSKVKTWRYLSYIYIKESFCISHNYFPIAYFHFTVRRINQLGWLSFNFPWWLLQLFRTAAFFHKALDQISDPIVVIITYNPSQNSYDCDRDDMRNTRTDLLTEVFSLERKHMFDVCHSIIPDIYPHWTWNFAFHLRAGIERQVSPFHESLY